MKTDEGYELIKGLIETGAANDPKVRSLLDRIAKGDADFKTTSEYSRIVSEILGTSLSEHILDLDGEAREEVCRMLLHDRYEDINDVLAEVQTSLNAKTGINIRPKKPPFQSERVASFAHSLADLTVADQVIKRRAKNGSANISMSDHDRYMKANAELRNKAGLKCYIERETDGKCCEWCTKMAGRYAYPDDTPKDVFRRHDNCGCSVTYKNGRQRQDVWSKKTWEADKDERISKASGKEPTVFTKADAQAKQSEILARKELTYGVSRGIIKSIDVDDYKIIAGGKGISQEVNDVIINTMKKCEKDGQFVISEISDKISPSNTEGTPVLQIEPMVNGLLRLNVNTEFLSGKSLAEINEVFAGTERNLAQTLEEAIVHESGHAILIKGKTAAQIEVLYKELEPLGKTGVSNIALKDGVECLAELEILRYRKTPVSKELSDFYKKYMGREYL